MTNTEAGIPTVVTVATLVATRQPVNTHPNAGKRRAHRCHTMRTTAKDPIRRCKLAAVGGGVSSNEDRERSRDGVLFSLTHRASRRTEYDLHHGER